MRMRGTAVAVVVTAFGLLSAGCGGGDSGDAASSPPPTTASGSGSGATKADAKLPAFSTDFDRVCTTQVGFPGAKAYEGGPGVHPVMLFEEYRGDKFLPTSRTLPDGWAVKEDSDYEDNRELAAIELIACSDMVKETPTGKRCQFDDKETGKVELEIVDATYEVKVYAAATGKSVGEPTTIVAKTTDCPFIAVFKKGDTTYVSQPSDDDYINALKAHVVI